MWPKLLFKIQTKVFDNSGMNESLNSEQICNKQNQIKVRTIKPEFLQYCLIWLPSIFQSKIYFPAGFLVFL